MIFLKCDKSRSKKSFFGQKNHANITTMLRKYLEVALSAWNCLISLFTAS